MGGGANNLETWFFRPRNRSLPRPGPGFSLCIRSVFFANFNLTNIAFLAEKVHIADSVLPSSWRRRVVEVATASSELCQTTTAVTSLVEVSEKVAVAVKGWVRPFATLAEAGATVMEVSDAAVTSSCAVSERSP